MGISVGVAGASGYAGGELLRLLAGHPTFDVARLFAQRAAGTRVAEAHPNLVSLADLPIESLSRDAVSALDVLFLCLPAGQAAQAASLAPDSTLVVDVSGDHR